MEEEDIPLQRLAYSKEKKKKRKRSHGFHTRRAPHRGVPAEEPSAADGGANTVVQYMPSRMSGGDPPSHSNMELREPIATAFYGSSILGETGHPFPELVFPEVVHRLPSVSKALDEMLGDNMERLDPLSVHILRQMAVRIVSRVVPSLMELLQGDNTSLRTKGVCEATLRYLTEESERASTSDASLASAKVLFESLDFGP